MGRKSIHSDYINIHIFGIFSKKPIYLLLLSLLKDNFSWNNINLEVIFTSVDCPTFYFNLFFEVIFVIRNLLSRSMLYRIEVRALW